MITCQVWWTEGKEEWPNNIVECPEEPTWKGILQDGFCVFVCQKHYYMHKSIFKTVRPLAFGNLKAKE